jgi:histidinol dehydrogenase
MSLPRVYEGLQAARDAIIASRRFGEVDLPEPVRARIRAVFGADLTAGQVVERVVAEVRA